MAGKRDKLPSDDEDSETNQRDLRRVRPDLCMDGDDSSDRNEAPPPMEEIPRRDENPFSFKRFLNQDCRGGARRKEYSPDGTPVLHTPEMSSVLPDFVQDHLVVEQCYLPQSVPHHNPMPFDLPRPAEERIDPNVAMSLPDFLSDGPIHSQRGDADLGGYLGAGEPSTSNGHHSSPTSSSRSEIDRWRMEVDNLRRQLHEKTTRIHVLESEISQLRVNDARHAETLEQALDQVENNFQQTSMKMVAAENKITKLKAENKMLKARLEGNETSGSSSHSRNPRLAQELRGAAGAAEVHLRALMAGVENLRILASKVGQSDSGTYDLEDRNETGSDQDGEGATGPAL